MPRTPPPSDYKSAAYILTKQGTIAAAEPGKWIIMKTLKEKQREPGAQRPRWPRARKKWTMTDIKPLIRFLMKK
jgi:hypothetical protein